MVLFLSSHAQILAGDDVEVVKAVSPDEAPERSDDPDQVALESVDQEGAPTLHFQHGPPPPPGPSKFTKKIALVRERFGRT